MKKNRKWTKKEENDITRLFLSLCDEVYKYKNINKILKKNKRIDKPSKV